MNDFHVSQRVHHHLRAVLRAGVAVHDFPLQRIAPAGGEILYELGTYAVQIGMNQHFPWQRQEAGELQFPPNAFDSLVRLLTDIQMNPDLTEWG